MFSFDLATSSNKSGFSSLHLLIYYIFVIQICCGERVLPPSPGHQWSSHYSHDLILDPVFCYLRYYDVIPLPWNIVLDKHLLRNKLITILLYHEDIIFYWFFYRVFSSGVFFLIFVGYTPNYTNLLFLMNISTSCIFLSFSLI